MQARGWLTPALILLFIAAAALFSVDEWHFNQTTLFEFSIPLKNDRDSLIRLNNLCLTEDNRFCFATASFHHVVLAIDIETSNSSPNVTYGMYMERDLVDGLHHEARFNTPRGCTPFGDDVLIADWYNNALRLISPNTMQVSTAVVIESPVEVEAINRSHAVVTQWGQTSVYLYDSNRQIIELLFQSTSLNTFLNFFIDYTCTGFYAVVYPSDQRDTSVYLSETIAVYYLPLTDLLAKRNATDLESHNYKLVVYNKASTAEEICHGNAADTTLPYYSQSHGADVQSHLILPDSNNGMLHIIDKIDFSTSVGLCNLGSPTDVILLRTRQGTMLVPDKNTIKKLDSPNLPAASNQCEPKQSSTDSPTETPQMSGFGPLPAVEQGSAADTGDETASRPGTSANVKNPLHTASTTVSIVNHTTRSSVITTNQAAHSQTDEVAIDTTTSKTSNSESTNSVTTTSETTSSETPISETTTSKTTNSETATSKMATCETATCETTSQQQGRPVYGSVIPGKVDYTSVNGKLCPKSAVMIDEVFMDRHICSLLCSNLVTCGGFNYNKETRKCVLVEAWSPECEYRNTRNPKDYCYTKM